MSLGINTLMKILKLTTELIGNRGFDIEIVEIGIDILITEAVYA